MTKFSNIYDIDGNLIRRADQGAFTLEETEQLVDELTKKVQENPDNEVYKVYLNNAQKWLFNLYNNMSREDLMKRMSFIQNSVNEAKNAATEAEQQELEQINKAVEELKNAYDNESETPMELENTLEQGDLLVDREGVETIMEEVIDETDKEDIHTLHSGEPEADETTAAE